MIHIILEASKDVTIQRIKNDCIRDQATQSQQIANVEWQIKRYGRPDGTIYVIFQFCLPTVAPFIFHVFFIGFCFLAGRHRFLQTIFYLPVNRNISSLWKIKGKDNEYDKEAIKVLYEGLGKIGYVANSSYTVIGDSMSAGRIYDKIGKKAKAKVVFITDHGTICSISKKSLLDNQKKVKKSETEID